MMRAVARILLLLLVVSNVSKMPRVAWAPQPGAQVLLMACPFWEALVEGNRGGGKTGGLLGDFAQHCGPKRSENHLAGYGPSWRGVLFRRTFPELTDFIAKSKALFAQVFPAAKYNEGSFTWKWPSGEELLLRHASRLSDIDGFQGHEYPWIAWEELGTWATADLYHRMKACSRSSLVGMPRKIRSTCNPAGVGHNWIKRYFIDSAPAGVPHQDKDGNWRVRIHSDLRENAALLAAEPNYRAKIASAAGNNPAKLKAWLDGSWDIVSGGMFDDVWFPERQVKKPFAIPASWRIDRAFDWGSSKPFSVGWWAESDGTGGNGVPLLTRGSLVRIAEFYGCQEDEDNVGLRMPDVKVAELIVEAEKRLKIRDRVQAGPADSSIFVAEPGKLSIADAMTSKGVQFLAADKRPGSRKTGWEKMRRYFAESAKERPEDPGLYVVDTCRHFIRTVPVLPRDERDPDDVNTEAEDHIGDETRYRVTAVRMEVTSSRFKV